MHVYYTFLALDLARERAAEASAQRLAHQAHVARSDVGTLRRFVARAALAVARAADGQVEHVSLTTS
jgi:hypothetical protein